MALLNRHWPALLLLLLAAWFVLWQVRAFRRRQHLPPLPTLSEANRSVDEALRDQHEKRDEHERRFERG